VRNPPTQTPKEEVFMVRKLSLLVGLIFLVSLTAHAQDAGDKVELFGGYSYLRTDSPSTNLNGWELSGQYKFAPFLGAVADFDGHYGSPFGPSTSFHTFLFGPQISFPARVSPFAHVLFGGAHVESGPFSDTSFAMGIGAGIDARLAGPIHWRVIQGDYLPTWFGNTREGNLRLSTGIVLHF
jgi:hypothetical protein